MEAARSPMTFFLTFAAPENVTNPGQDGVQYAFPFTLVDSALRGAPEEQSQTQEHRFIIGISRTRLAGWKISDSDIPKILFEFGRRYIATIVESSSLPADYTIRCPLISTESHPEPQCPFEPARIPTPAGFSVEVEQAKPPIGFGSNQKK